MEIASFTWKKNILKTTVNRLEDSFVFLGVFVLVFFYLKFQEKEKLPMCLWVRVQEERTGTTPRQQFDRPPNPKNVVKKVLLNYGGISVTELGKKLQEGYLTMYLHKLLE